MTEPAPRLSPYSNEAQGPGVDPLENLIADAVNDLSPGGDQDDADPAAGRYSAESGAIINLARQIVIQALQEGATDIHLESGEKQFTLRYRVDGTLHCRARLPLKLRRALLARFKIMARMDPADGSGPRDGRLKARLSNSREVDFQVSSLPTLFGESMVLRTCDQPGPELDLARLGLTRRPLKLLTEAIHRPAGLVVVTGPAGAGKTATLYSCLAARNTDDVKILTIEDAVTVSLPGLNQVDASRTGLTAADAFNIFARQDPDICFIGEIRDPATTRLAVETALAGRLVFATLHTVDTPSAVTRLIDLGAPPADLSKTLTLVVAQRLVRRICPRCQTPLDQPSAEAVLKEAGFTPGEAENIRLHQGRGCPWCQGAGHRGRLRLFEVMAVTPSLADALANRAPEARLREIAWEEGLRPLRQDGLLKVMRGLTTLEQVLANTPQFLPDEAGGSRPPAWGDWPRAEEDAEADDGDGPEPYPAAGLTGSEETLRCIVGHQIGGQTFWEKGSGGTNGRDRVAPKPLVEVSRTEMRIDPAVAPKACPLKMVRLES